MRIDMILDLLAGISIFVALWVLLVLGSALM